MSSVKSADENLSLLTVIIPTRNRAAQCATQLRFFRDCGVGYRILVADSSDPEQAEKVRSACEGIADYRYYDSKLRIIDKWAQMITEITTPYVVMTPDDDITFPHAIDAALAALIENPDYAAAHGYVLNFAMHADYFDIHSVFSFTPTIDEDDPLRRHYQLMRRYQPFIWAVFRTPGFAAALNAAAKINGTIFQELTFMNVALLHGKIMRLGMVYAMRGSEESLSPAVEVDPFTWYLKDADEFFVLYAAYRNALAQSVRSMNIAVPEATRLDQLIDVVHGTWLGREIDLEKIDREERKMWREDPAAIPVQPKGPEWRALEKNDVVHPSAVDSRQYVWREAVNAAKPLEEIAIDKDEMAAVERQLNLYKPLNLSLSSI